MEMHCSFCGKSQHDVKKLIAGPSVFVCDDCVIPCFRIIGEIDDDLNDDALRERVNALVFCDGDRAAETARLTAMLRRQMDRDATAARQAEEMRSAMPEHQTAADLLVTLTAKCTWYDLVDAELQKVVKLLRQRGVEWPEIRRAAETLPAPVLDYILGAASDDHA